MAQQSQISFVAQFLIYDVIMLRVLDNSTYAIIRVYDGDGF